MSQQINLINPALIKQKDYLTTLNIGSVYGALVLLMLGWYGYTTQQVHTFKASRDQLATQLQQQQATLEAMNAERAPKAPNQALVATLQSLEEKHRMQTQILQVMQQGKPAQDKGLANYMLGLARQSTDGLWLTGFSIDQTHHAVSLRGRSLDAALLPDYMHQLGREAVFAGQAFSGLRIYQPEPTANPVPAAQATATAAASTSTPVPNAPAPVAFVEFELQAKEVLPETSASTSANAPANPMPTAAEVTTTAPKEVKS